MLEQSKGLIEKLVWQSFVSVFIFQTDKIFPPDGSVYKKASLFLNSPVRDRLPD